MDSSLDLTKPIIRITDYFTKSGKHLKTITATEEGTMISEEGPNPNKDVVFIWSKVWRD